MFRIECESIEELTLLKEKAQRAKCIALAELGKSPITNVTYLNNKDKKQLSKRVNQIFTVMSSEEIIAKFNDIINDDILDPKTKYCDMPVYKGIYELKEDE